MSLPAVVLMIFFNVVPGRNAINNGQQQPVPEENTKTQPEDGVYIFKSTNCCDLRDDYHGVFGGHTPFPYCKIV
jgi:hypothetical protein